MIRIGRSTDNHVILYSAVVSRHHVELRRTDNGWEIMSLGTNGTYLDGKRITQIAAENGIIIRLARSGPNIQIRLGAEGQNRIQALLARKHGGNQAEPTVPEAKPANPPLAKTHTQAMSPILPGSSYPQSASTD